MDCNTWSLLSSSLKFVPKSSGETGPPYFCALFVASWLGTTGGWLAIPAGVLFDTERDMKPNRSARIPRLSMRIRIRLRFCLFCFGGNAFPLCFFDYRVLVMRP